MSVSAYRPCLVVYVIWHPDFEKGKDFANYIYSLLTRDVREPISRGIGIPVFFRSIPFSTDKVPPEIHLDHAQRSAIVVLVDDNMVNSAPWNVYVENLWQQTRGIDSPHRLYPASVTPNATNLTGDVSRAQFIRLYQRPENEMAAYLDCILTHELCRLLLNRKRISAITKEDFSPAPVKLFVSHAKRDGLKIAEALCDYIGRELPLKTFFDATDIAVSYAFDEEIYAHMQDGALLAILTDAYGSREWCRREILAAKKIKIPIVVLNAVASGEERSFPYLGNVPTIRWNSDSIQPEASSSRKNIEATIHLMLYEVLRRTYWLHNFEDLCNLSLIPSSAKCLIRPPELLDLLGCSEDTTQSRSTYFVYPDPPLGESEAKLLESFFPGLKLSTPIFLEGRK